MIFFIYAAALFLGAALALYGLHRRHLKNLASVRAHDQLQASLINILVHDIMNPILAARFSLENLKRNIPSEFHRSVLLAIDSVEELNKLVQRVRDLRAFESGRKHLRISNVCVNDLLKSVEKTFSARAASKDIQLVVIPDEQAVFVDVDPVIFLTNVLNNLVDNAIKFSRKGRRVEITAYATDALVEFSVSDEGVGMDERLAASLCLGLDDTVRADPSGESGTGIGMLQVNNYLRLTGGSIEIQSRPETRYPEDHGTTVKIRLPRTQQINGDQP